MYIDPSPSFRPLAVKHHCDPSGVCFIPPHDHLGEVIGPLLPSGKDAALAKVFADLMRLANRVLEHHPVTEKRRAEGKLGANGIWFWAAGTAMQLPDFREEYGCGGAVISAYMHYMLGDQDRALEYILRTLPDTDKFGYHTELYSLYANILHAQGDDAGAERYYLMALDHIDQKVVTAAVMTYLSYGTYLNDRGEYARAIPVLRQGIELSERSNNAVHRYKLYLRISEAETALGRYREALDYFKSYHSQADSIFNVERERSINELRVKYDAERQENMLRKSEIDLIRQQRRFQLLLLLLLLLILLQLLLLLLLLLLLMLLLLLLLLLLLQLLLLLLLLFLLLFLLLLLLLSLILTLILPLLLLLLSLLLLLLSLLLFQSCFLFFEKISLRKHY